MKPLLLSSPDAPVSKNNKQYLPVLTGLRAMAAYMVFLCHDNIFASTANEPVGQLQNFLGRFTSALSIGVTVFFVLSGFLITLRYQNSIQLSWSWALRYLRNRVARIYPIYFLVTMITLLATVLKASYDPSRLWRFYALKDKILVVFLNLTFLRGFFDRFYGTMAGQGWSLTVEECFYLSAPLMLLVLRKSWKWLLLYPILLLGIGSILVSVGSSHKDLLYGFFGSMQFMLSWTFFGRCTEFILGMGLALYMYRHPTEGRNGFLATLLGLSWMIIYAGASAFSVQNSGDSGYTGSLRMEDYVGFSLANVILPIGIVLLFWGLLHEKTLLRRLLETRLFQLLGKSSYSFYLIHVGVLDFLLNDYVSHNILVKFIIINLVAIALYKFVEHPIHALLSGQRNVERRA